MPNWSTIGTLAITKKRILLKRGDVWSMNSTATIGSTANGEGIIGAYGSGALPKVSMDVDASAFNLNQTNDWRIMDFEITTNMVTGSSKVAISSSQ